MGHPKGRFRFQIRLQNVEVKNLRSALGVKQSPSRFWEEEDVKRVNKNPEGGSVQAGTWPVSATERNCSDVLPKIEMC